MSPQRRVQHGTRHWTWWRLLPLDSAMAWAIVLVCLGLCMHRLMPFLEKLRLAEAVVNLPSQTWPLVESLALSGSLDGTPPTEPQATKNFSYGLRDGQAVAEGTARDGHTAQRLGMRLAVQQPGLGWHVLPLCGLNPAPPGWHSAAPALATGITDAQLPWICSQRVRLAAGPAATEAPRP